LTDLFALFEQRGLAQKASNKASFSYDSHHNEKFRKANERETRGIRSLPVILLAA
jgi:hypothetical protein